MNLQVASRKRVKIKMALQGPSGSGKTYSALLLAFGLCNDFSKICVIDAESNSASLYSHLGEFNVINITAPFNPEIYIQAIELCEQSGIEVIIIDSISQEWSGKGGCLDLHEKETARMRIPNSFTAWASITPKHQAFIDAIVNCSSHVITTIRSKTEYVLTERNGKQVPQKVGMAPITRDGFDFEVTIAFDIDQLHKIFCTKDRTGLFMDKESFVITPDTGRKILEWCNSGEIITIDEVTKRIGNTISINELLDLYYLYPQFKEVLKPEYEKRKRHLIISNTGKEAELTNNQSNLTTNATN